MDTKKFLNYFTPESLETIRKNTALTNCQKAVKNRKRDLYLRRKYAITLDEYNRMLADQGGVCAVCLRPGVTRSLAVDHDHKCSRIKIKTNCIAAGIWHAAVSYRSFGFLTGGETKSEAIKNARNHLKKESIRGLLCPNCNTGLRKYGDDPDRLLRASEYLRKFHNHATISGVPASNIVVDNYENVPQLPQKII